MQSNDTDNHHEDSGAEPENDEDYMSAKDYVLSTGKASTSSLQTAFRWGYNKAARIMNDLERYSVIGPARPGERYRELLTSGNQSKSMQSEGDTESDPLDTMFENTK